jgi:D-alanyl-D-alanine carboxypeptidase/D-alanyl-D-alanine-endopeptidase (penicillin-binding protein 4)
VTTERGPGRPQEEWPTVDLDPGAAAPRQPSSPYPPGTVRPPGEPIPVKRPPQQEQQPQQPQARPRPAPDVPLHEMPTRIIPAVEPPQPPEPEPDPQPEGAGGGKRKRRLMVLVVLAVVVVLLAAAAVVLTRPSVANRLMLPWAPNKPLADEPAPMTLSRAITVPTAKQPPTPGGVEKALASVVGDPALGVLAGVVVDPLTGDVLWEKDPGLASPPASTLKILTTAAALLELGPDARLTTRVVQGAPREVILVGSGDPTLTVLKDSEDSFYPGAATVDELAEQVRKATGGKVDIVRVSTAAYRGPATGPGWDPSDAPSTYAAPIEPVMVDGGRLDPTRFDADRALEPALEAARALATRLDAQAVSGEPDVSEDADVLGEVQSPPVEELVTIALTDSDNVLSEALARWVATERGEEPSFDGAAKAVRAVLEEAGFDLAGVEIADGSGLSPESKVPPRLLADILTAAAGDDEVAQKLRPLLAGLPVAGGTGTLSDRYVDGQAEQAKGWVRAKTGTLDRVNTLAGTVLTESGSTLVFALMSVGTDQQVARPALDDVVGALRGCGCS